MPKLKRLARFAAEDRTLSELRTAILNGVLPPGTRLLQVDLAGQMGVSRMPIRQALLALEREGLVRTDRWHGTVVAPLDSDFVRDMYAFRAVVERHVAETLAQRADFDSAPIRKVIASGRKAVASGDINAAIEQDLRFHTMLYDSVGNQVLSSVMHGQWAHIRRVMAVTLTVPTLRKRVWDEHATILDAVDAHDAARAAAEAEAHMRTANATLLEQMATAAEEQAIIPAPRRRTSKSRTRSGQVKASMRRRAANAQ
jgi:DNA-binding GntR family transcriptional regulator